MARPSSTIVATRSISEHWPFPQPLLHSPYSPSDFVSLLLSPSPISCSNGSAPSHSLPLSGLQNHLLTTLLSSFVGVLNKPPIRPMAKLRKRYNTYWQRSNSNPSPTGLLRVPPSATGLPASCNSFYFSFPSITACSSDWKWCSGPDASWLKDLHGSYWLSFWFRLCCHLRPFLLSF